MKKGQLFDMLIYIRVLIFVRLRRNLLYAQLIPQSGYFIYFRWFTLSWTDMSFQIKSAIMRHFYPIL